MVLLNYLFKIRHPSQVCYMILKLVVLLVVDIHKSENKMSARMFLLLQIEIYLTGILIAANKNGIVPKLPGTDLANGTVG